MIHYDILTITMAYCDSLYGFTHSLFSITHSSPDIHGSMGKLFYISFFKFPFRLWTRHIILISQKRLLSIFMS